MTTVGFCEIEPFCQRVLKKHWPDVPLFEDVRNVTGELVRERCGHIDLICAGVPCQPASVAGKRKGASDDRWMWPELLRVVSQVEPLFLLAENPRGVTSLRVGGMQFSEWIAREFAARGYELLPVELAAEDVGAPHRRERIFFTAKQLGNAEGDRRNGQVRHNQWQAIREALRSGAQPDVGDAVRGGFRFVQSWQSGQVIAAGCSNVANADSGTGATFGQSENQGRATDALGGNGAKMADTVNAGLEGQWDGTSGTGAEVALSPGFGSYQWPARPGQPQHGWEEPRVIESALGCAVAGLSERLARRHRVASLKALGNSIVPQVAEVIGRAIIGTLQK